MTPRERHIDIQNLKKYPEFYAFKMEMEDFCNKLDSLSEVKLDVASRITLGEEIAGRIWARDQVRDLLSTLGLVDKSKPVMINRTGE